MVLHNNLSSQVVGDTNNSNNNDGKTVNAADNAMARRLLERLLEPSRQSRAASAKHHHRYRHGHGAGSMGGEALVRGLDPLSVAALMRLQVK